jgi:hypothetical protein
MNPRVHKRFLDYRDRHVYFGRKKPMVSAAEFEAMDAEYQALLVKGEERDDEEEARFAEVAFSLHLD